ncbi:hypothetical protein BJ165DRAFT_1468038 [Panaeolus papilionaceus]|nr:hypothetical protein BJ165DRAFT_1468038 [Panaeolus papilionaceus]
MQSNTPQGPLFIATPPYDNLKFTGTPTVVAENPPAAGTPASHMILLLGPTGSGKSAFVEALSGKGASLGISKDQLEGVTQEVVCYRLDNVCRGCQDHYHCEDGHSVYVVDTPGFSDSKVSELKVFTMLLDWMKKHTIALDKHGLNTVIHSNPISRILYFHPITATRVSGSSHGLLQMLADLAVNDLSTLKQRTKMDKISIVTTMWDQVSASEKSLQKAHTRFEQMMSPNGPCKNFIKNGCRILKFENTQKSAMSISDSRTIGRTDQFQFLHLERIILRNQSIRDTRFGRPLYDMLCRRIQTLVNEKSNVSIALEGTGNSSISAAHWADYQANVEGQLLELQHEKEAFWPSPDDVDGFVPFRDLFNDGAEVCDGHHELS